VERENVRAKKMDEEEQREERRKLSERAQDLDRQAEANRNRRDIAKTEVLLMLFVLNYLVCRLQYGCVPLQCPCILVKKHTYIHTWIT
jgi:hypothetical protein